MICFLCGVVESIFSLLSIAHSGSAEAVVPCTIDLLLGPSFLKTRFTSNENIFPVSRRYSLFYEGKGWASGPAFAFIKEGELH